MDVKENNENETISIADKVEILSTDDNKIKSIGEILSSDSSRHILRLLFNDALTANQISQKTGISLPLVIYHLKKMQESNVVKITNVGKNSKSHDMKFYTIDKLAIVILPEQLSSPAKKSKSLINSFSRIHRLATLGAVSAAAWFTSQFLQIKSSSIEHVEDISSSSQMAAPEMAQKTLDVPQESGGGVEMFAAPVPPQTQTPSSEPTLDMVWSVVTVLSVIVAWLVIELAIKHKQSKITT